MYKLLMLGALVGVGVAIAKFIKGNKAETQESIQTPEQPSAA